MSDRLAEGITMQIFNLTIQWNIYSTKQKYV